MIKVFKNLLHHLFVSQGVEFHEKAVENLQEPVSKISLLTSVWNKFKLKVDALSAAFKRAKKFVQTAELVGLDNDRDGLTKRIIDIVKGAFDYPINELEKNAAALLMPVVDNYLAAGRLEYEANTAYLSHFVKELKSAKYSQALTVLNLLPLVTALETKNNTFKSVYTERMEEMEKNRTEGTTRDFLHAANKALAEVAEAVTGMLRLQLDAPTMANLNEIVFKLNALIDQYTIIYHRHAGIIASHNNNGDDGDGGDDGSDFQEPDISNPPAPFE